MTELEGHFEIVSLVGTISEYGSHIHISIADEEGKMVINNFYNLKVWRSSSDGCK